MSSLGEHVHPPGRTVCPMGKPCLHSWVSAMPARAGKRARCSTTCEPCRKAFPSSPTDRMCPRSHGTTVTYRLPARPQANSPKSQSQFASRLQAMEQVLEPRGGLIVYFNGMTRRNLVSGEDLLPHLPLRVLFRSDQGIIYQAGEW